MKPPYCAICGKKFYPTNEPTKENQGSIIYFTKDRKDLEWDKHREEHKGFIGHPPYAEWFCTKHYQIAIKLKNMNAREAIKEIKKKLDFDTDNQ